MFSSYKIVRFVMQIMLDISKNFETYVNGVMKLIYLMKIHKSIIIVFYWEFLSYLFTLSQYAATLNWSFLCEFHFFLIQIQKWRNIFVIVKAV